MSTSFGEFKDKEGNQYYFTTSQGSGTTYLCQGDDTRVIMTIAYEEMLKLKEQAKLAVWYAEGCPDET